MHTAARVLEVLGVFAASTAACSAVWAVSGYRRSVRDDRVHIRAGRQPVDWHTRVMLTAAAAGLTVLIACTARLVSMLGGLL